MSEGQGAAGAPLPAQMRRQIDVSAHASSVRAPSRKPYQSARRPPQNSGAASVIGESTERAPRRASAPTSAREPWVHAQPGNLNEAICVLQLKLPEVFRYSVVNQNVQSSTGSTLMLL